MRFSQVNHLPIKDIETSQIPGGLVAHWERALVGQLAREVHARGMQFEAWPTVKQVPMFYDFHYGFKEVDSMEAATVLRLEADVEAVPR